MAAFAKARVAAAKIFRIIDHKSGVERNNELGLELESVAGQVELKNVDFSYPSRPEVRILSNFSLTVPAGKTIALVGSSGSGKSTVVSLIERFYDPTSGKCRNSIISIGIHSNGGYISTPKRPKLPLKTASLFIPQQLHFVLIRSLKFFLTNNKGFG